MPRRPRRLPRQGVGAGDGASRPSPASPTNYAPAGTSARSTAGCRRQGASISPRPAWSWNKDSWPSGAERTRRRRSHTRTAFARRPRGTSRAGRRPKPRSTSFAAKTMSSRSRSRPRSGRGGRGGGGGSPAATASRWRSGGSGRAAAAAGASRRTSVITPTTMSSRGSGTSSVATESRSPIGSCSRGVSTAHSGSA